MRCIPSLSKHSAAEATASPHFSTYSGMDRPKSFIDSEYIDASDKIQEIDQDILVQESFEFEANPDDRDFTWRAAILGSLLGAIISLSNIYLGLKYLFYLYRIGITQGSTLFATMLGGIFMKPALVVFDHFNKKHSMLGPKEHCCFQSAATASGALQGGLTAGVIGLFWMQYDDELGAQQSQGFKGLAGENAFGIFLLVLAAVGFGIFMAVPYRSVFIINQNLQFPDGLAAAEIIKSSKSRYNSVYKKGRDKVQEDIQAKKMKVMMWSFVVGLVLFMLSQFFPTIINWPIFQNLSGCGSKQSPFSCLEHPPMISDQGPFMNETLPGPVYMEMALASAWGWKLSFDPVLMGTAFIVPHHVNVWFFIGAVLAFGIIGPISLMRGDFPAGAGLEAGKAYIYKHTIYWPAIFVVLVASFVNIGLEYKAFEGLFGGLKAKEGEVRLGFLERNRRDLIEIFRKKPDVYSDRSEENTPFVIWFGGTLILMVVTFFIYSFYFSHFGVLAWHSIVSMFVCIFLALVYLQILGKTNWGLTGVMGKVIVMILGAAAAPLAVLLIMGNLVSQTMSQIGDVIQCYKTGYLIRASPNAQFAANVVGTVVGIFAAVGGFLLFTISSPCILQYPTPDNCGVKAWYFLGQGFINGFKIGTGKHDTITPAGLYLTIAFSICAIVTNSAKKFLQLNSSPSTFKKFNPFFPLYAVAFIPFLLSPDLAVATLMGTVLKFAWERVDKESVKHYGISLGAGLMTGGALGGVLYAVMKIAGLSQKDVVPY